MIATVRRRVAARSDDLLVLLLFVGLTAAMFVRTWAHPTTQWIGWPGDPPQHMWFLRWLPFALGEGDNPLLTTHINHPDGVNLMWNTAMPLPAFVLAPVTLLLGTFVAFNLLVTIGVAFSGWCAYLLARRYVGSGPALAAGLVYGFSPYLMSQTLAGHSNLVQVWIVPLVFLTLDDVFVRQRRSPYVLGLVLGVLATVQLLITEELLASQALIATVVLVTLVAARRNEVRRRAPYAARAVAVGLVVTLVLSWVPLAVQFLGPNRVEGGTAQAQGIFSSDLVSFVLPSELQAISPAWSEDLADRYTDSCCRGEWGSYLGMPLIGLLVVVAIRYRRLLLVRVSAVVAVVAAVLSMGPRLHIAGDVTEIPLPFWVLDQIPVLQNMLARRLMLYAFLAIALLLAVFIDDRRRRDVTIRDRMRTGAILALALVPLLPEFPFPTTRGTVPSFFTTEAVQRLERGSVAVVSPFSRNPATSEPLLWQAKSGMWFRMPEGYILGRGDDGRYASLPRRTDLLLSMERLEAGEPATEIGPGFRSGTLQNLADAGVTSVIVGPGPHRSEVVRFWTQLLARRPVRTGGVHLWSDIDPAALVARDTAALATP